MNTTENQTTKTAIGAHRISAHQALKESGYTLDDCVDGTCPACCSEGCIVESDGECEHGFPSVLIACGMI